MKVRWSCHHCGVTPPLPRDSDDAAADIVQLYVDWRHGSQDPTLHKAAARLREVLEVHDIDVETIAESLRCAEPSCGDPIDGDDHPYCVRCALQISVTKETRCP